MGRVGYVMHTFRCGLVGPKRTGANVMKSNFRLLLLCLVSSSAMQSVHVRADAMQDILDKKADVERTLQEIEKYAALNGGNTVPDKALENQIGRLETHLRQMDLRLESLPPCKTAPTASDTSGALEALRRLAVDKADTKKQLKELEEKIEKIKKR